MAFREITAGSSYRGPALLLPRAVVAGSDAARPQFYYLQEGAQTVVVVNAEGVRYRIPEDELRDMAEERAAALATQMAEGREDYERAYRSWWLDYAQWVKDHARGQQSFGPATWSGTRHRS